MATVTVTVNNAMIDRLFKEQEFETAISPLRRVSLEGRVELAPMLDSSPVLSTVT